ncbi:MAG TPA: hypothetical protein VKS60_02165 [Stellaceae bacterium]|nr:hypothetical protein [Stellaceae bacterium]
MTEPVRTYVEALKERQHAERAIRDVIEFVKYVSNALERDSANFTFDNKPRLNPSTSRAGGSTYESSKWPTAQGLQELMMKWDIARKHVQDAWDALSADDRAILPSPDRRN